MASGSALSKMEEREIDSLTNYIDRYIQDFPAAQLGLGDLLRAQTEDQTDELRRRRLAQMGRPDLAGGIGGRAALASPLGMFGLGSGGLR
jgi:hypothetical protein